MSDLFHLALHILYVLTSRGRSNRPEGFWMSNSLARPSRHGSVLLSGVLTLDTRRPAPAALVAQRAAESLERGGSRDRNRCTHRVSSEAAPAEVGTLRITRQFTVYGSLDIIQFVVFESKMTHYLVPSLFLPCR